MIGALSKTKLIRTQRTRGKMKKRGTYTRLAPGIHQRVCRFPLSLGRARGVGGGQGVGLLGLACRRCFFHDFETVFARGGLGLEVPYQVPSCRPLMVKVAGSLVEAYTPSVVSSDGHLVGAGRGFQCYGGLSSPRCMCVCK